MKVLIMVIGLVGSCLIARPQQVDTFKRTMAFEKKSARNALIIRNINGSIRVESADQETITAEVKRTIKAKTDARVKEGVERIQLGVLDLEDTIIFYVKGVGVEFGRRSPNDFNRINDVAWGYQWHGGDREDMRFEYVMDFVVTVPRGVHVDVTTINTGDVEVTGVRGSVRAGNVNGSIRLKGIAGSTYASTVNGHVDVQYVGNPDADSKYYTLNGDIHANFVKGLQADVAFKSFNGSFYSSIDEVSAAAVMLEKSEGKTGIRYKVSGNRYKVRNGGPLLNFETFNGDVFMIEK